MKRLLFYAAATCFAASVLVHLASFTAIDVLKALPAVFLLHIAIFVIGPLVMCICAGGQRDLDRHIDRKFVPVLIALFLYAGINFFVTLGLNSAGVPSMNGGQYVLESHSHILKVLTPGEYAMHQNFIVRGFSGHWMLFYFLFTALACTSLKRHS